MPCKFQHIIKTRLNFRDVNRERFDPKYAKNINNKQSELKYEF